VADYLDDETHDDIWPRGLAAKRAASWWEAAKAYCRSDRVRAGQIAELVTERDALQARLDAVRAVLDRPWPDDEDHHDFVNGQVEAARAALQGDQPTEPGRRPLIDPADPCQDLRCRRIDGRCVGMHCARCGESCGAQGHTTCPTDVAAQPTGEADRG
jgi:hypothetical protein